MWQLGHSQSSGHSSCGQLAAEHRNHILGQLNPILACQDLSSRILFPPTKKPGYVLPWASPVCVSKPFSTLGTTGVCLHGYIRTQVISVPGKHWRRLLLSITMCLRNTNGFCGLWMLSCLNQHKAAAALRVSPGAYGNIQNLYSFGISCSFQCHPQLLG